MGWGNWSLSSHDKNTGSKIKSGTTFGYDSKTRASGLYKAHESVDPKKRNADGLILREARDSVEHPNSTPIVVGFDATGSMGTIPRIVQKNLTSLFSLLLRKGYAEDPQIAITAYGDSKVDYVPLQISQFESDNRIDENLDNLFLEGGGGGNGGETQTLLWYFLANHAVIDSYEKRGKKGYLFIIADEVPLDLTAGEIKKFIAPDEVNTKDLTVDGVVEHLKEKWDTYIILVDNWSARTQKSKEVYTRLFGSDHVIDVEDYDNVSELIGGAIGYLEGQADDETLTQDLVDTGVAPGIAQKTAKSLATLNRGSTLTKVDVDLPVDDDELATL